MIRKILNKLMKNKMLSFFLIILILEICNLLFKISNNLSFTKNISLQNSQIVSIFNNSQKSLIEPKFNNLSAIKFVFGTYKRKNTEILEFILYDVSGKILRTAKIETKNLRDNKEYIIKFKDIHDSKNKKYFFEIKSLNGTNENSVVLYKENNNILYDLGYNNFKIKILSIFSILGIFITNIFFIGYLYKNQNIKKEKVFLIFFTFYGLITLFLMPPFQIPDEHRHFYNSYKFSKGIYSNPANLPSSLVEFVENTEFNKISENFENKEYLLNLINFSKTKLLQEKTHQKEVYLKTTVAMYNPIVYIPQSLGLTVGLFLKLPILFGFYLGRLFVFFVCLVITYLSIKKAPEKIKSLILITSLFPIVIQEAISYSVDALINTFSFLFIAYFFKLYLKKNEKINWEYGLVFFLGIFIPTTAKAPYFLLILLLIGLPVNKFNSKKQYFLLISFIFIITIFVNFSWHILGPQNPAQNMKEQINYIRLNLINYAETLYLTTRDLFHSYLVESVGLLGIFYMLPYIFVYGYIIFLGIYTFSDRIIKRRDYRIRFYIIIYLIGTYVIMLSALYISWTSLGAKYVDGIQGRYFIPLIPILAIFVSKKKIILKKEELDLKTNLFLNFGLFYTIILLISRYYI